MGIGSKDKRDVYYYRAKSMGYRARSAFKLLDIESGFGVLSGAKNIVDLCAAPGSWSQVLSSSTSARVVAVDVQEMAPIPGVVCLKSDITSAECLRDIRNAFQGEEADLVVCDGAPDVTGMHDLDEYLQTDLLKASLAISCSISRVGAAFVGKCFRGEFTRYVVQHFRRFYASVDVVKPRSSRGASAECFLVCRDRRRSSADPRRIDIDCNPPSFEVKECGDGPDPDYTIECDADPQAAPSQPIEPPYQQSIGMRRAANRRGD